MAFKTQNKLLSGNYFYIILLYKSCPTTRKKIFPFIRRAHSNRIQRNKLQQN